MISSPFKTCVCFFFSTHDIFVFTPLLSFSFTCLHCYARMHTLSAFAFWLPRHLRPGSAVADYAHLPAAPTLPRPTPLCARALSLNQTTFIRPFCTLATFLPGNGGARGITRTCFTHTFTRGAHAAPRYARARALKPNFWFRAAPCGLRVRFGSHAAFALPRRAAFCGRMLRSARPLPRIVIRYLFATRYLRATTSAGALLARHGGFAVCRASVYAHTCHAAHALILCRMRFFFIFTFKADKDGRASLLTALPAT